MCWGIKVKNKVIGSDSGWEYLGHQENVGFSFGYNTEEASIFLTVEEAMFAIDNRNKYFNSEISYQDIDFVSSNQD